MKNILIFFLVIASASYVSAKEPTPAEEMLHVMGIHQVLEQAKEIQRKAAEEQIQIVMKQISPRLAQLPPEVVEEVNVLFRDMMNNILNSWTVEKATEVYAKAWNDNYTEEQIATVIKKYSDPKMKKDLEMVMAASNQLGTYIQDSYSRAMEKEFASFMEKLQEIMTRKAAADKDGSAHEQP